MTISPFERLNPKRRDTIDRIWSAMRIMPRDIDIPVLAMTASAPESSTGDYVRLLVRAGYVTVTRCGNARKGTRSIYRLVRNSGPKAPRRAINVMADPNDGAIYDLPHRTTPRVKRRISFEGLAA
jgi:hypothetical protein